MLYFWYCCLNKINVCVCWEESALLLRFFESSLKEQSLFSQSVYSITICFKCSLLGRKCLWVNWLHSFVYCLRRKKRLSISVFFCLIAKLYHLYSSWKKRKTTTCNFAILAYFTYWGYSNSGQFWETVKYFTVWRKTARMLYKKATFVPKTIALLISSSHEYHFTSDNSRQGQIRKREHDLQEGLLT